MGDMRHLPANEPDPLHLRFGLNDVWPTTAENETVTTWGARLIVNQDGYVDFVPDRQDAQGEDQYREELLARLNHSSEFLFEGKSVLQRVKESISWLLRSGLMQTRTDEYFELFSDVFGWPRTTFSFNMFVVANTNASAGYCYVTAFLVNVFDDSERWELEHGGGEEAEEE